MFITFYDRNFNALANNSSLVVESYNLKHRAYDFNDFSCTCEPIDLDVEPMFAILKSDTGGRYYDMLRPIITRDKQNKSNVIARDLIGIFNTECVIDFSAFHGETVKDFFEFVFSAWREYSYSGFDNITLNLDEVSTSGKPYHPTENAVYNVYELITKAIAIYDLFIFSKMNMHSKTVEFYIKPNNSRIMRIRLEDYGIENFGKSEPSTNTAIVDSNVQGFVPHEWFLLRSGEITTDSSKRDVFPTSAKVFYIDGSNKNIDEFSNKINEADFEAIALLAENRYQESIEIEVQQDYNRFKDIFFETSFEVYHNRNLYKTLPIGEIEDKGNENIIFKLGYKPNDFIQVV